MHSHASRPRFEPARRLVERWACARNVERQHQLLCLKEEKELRDREELVRSYEERDFYKHARRTWDMFGEMFEDGVRATSEFIQKVFGPPPAPEYEEDDEYEVFGR